MATVPTDGRKPSRKGEWVAPDMSVDVRNFGPIEKGRMELRPLTVFVGPSNAGKSWLSALIYIMARYPHGILSRSGLHGARDFAGGKQPFPDDPGRWRREIVERGTVRLSERENKFVRQVTKSLLEETFGEEFLRCYGGTGLSDLVRYGHSGSANITVRFGVVQHNLTVSGKTGKLSAKTIVPDELSIPVDLHENIISRELEFSSGDGTTGDSDKMQPSRSARWILSDVLRQIHSRRNLDSAYYLPAGRSGVMSTHTAVVGTLVRQASYAGLRTESPTPVLSGILSDFLGELVNMGKPHRKERDPAIDLGRHILGGSVDVEKSESGLPRFLYSPEGWDRKLPLMDSSSMVSELASVALYMRHLVGRSDLLILEEPEAHLHPSIQQKFVEEIATWVNRGVRVILTTHSEWVLRKLSNMVACGEAGEKTPCALQKKDVGVWLFDRADQKHPHAGSKIREVKWEADEGGYEAGFYDVAIDAQNEWAEIMSASSDEKMGA